MNNKLLALHPILDLQARNTVEMISITCNNYEIFLKCGCGNEQIHVANFHALLFQLPSYFTIFAKTMYGVRFKERCNLAHLVEMFLFARFISTKEQFRKCNIRNLAIIRPNFSKMPDDVLIFLQQCYARISIKQINSMCKHNHQVSTLRTVSAPCRNSRAISIGVPFPPQSPLILDRKASSMELSSSSRLGAVFRNSSQYLSASASSRSTCADICSTNQRRSWRFRWLSIVSTASIGIVPVIVFILHYIYVITPQNYELFLNKQIKTR